jgi:hypothetical protein
MLRSQHALSCGEHLAVDLLGLGMLPLVQEAECDVVRTSECMWMLRSQYPHPNAVHLADHPVRLTVLPFVNQGRAQIVRRGLPL